MKDEARASAPFLHPSAFILHPFHRGTSMTSLGPRLSRNVRVSARSNFGSLDSMAMKNLSRLACSAKLGMLNSGWYGCGNPFRASIPSTALNAAHSTVHSNVIGIHAGQELNGRPPM